MRTMWDSTDASNIPLTAKMAAGYINGNWPSYFKIPVSIPKRLTISVFPNAKAQIFDFEDKDCQPKDGPGILKANPTCSFYSSRSMWDEIRVVLDNAKIGHPPWWAAVPGYPVGTLYPGSVATQSRKINGCDVSDVADFWSGIDEKTEDDDMALVRDATTGRIYLQTSDGRLWWIPDTTPDLASARIQHGNEQNYTSSFLKQFPGYIAYA